MSLASAARHIQTGERCTMRQTFSPEERCAIRDPLGILHGERVVVDQIKLLRLPEDSPLHSHTAFPWLPCSAALNKSG